MDKRNAKRRKSPIDSIVSLHFFIIINFSLHRLTECELFCSGKCIKTAKSQKRFYKEWNPVDNNKIDSNMKYFEYFMKCINVSFLFFKLIDFFRLKTIRRTIVTIEIIH